MNTAKKRYSKRPQIVPFSGAQKSQPVTERASSPQKMTKGKQPQANSQVNKAGGAQHSEPITTRSRSGYGTMYSASNHFAKVNRMAAKSRRA